MKLIKDVLIISPLELIIFYHLLNSNLHKQTKTFKEIENDLGYSGNPLRVRQVLKNLIKERVLLSQGYRYKLISQETFSIDKSMLKKLIEKSIQYRVMYNIIWEKGYPIPLPGSLKLTRIDK